MNRTSMLAIAVLALQVVAIGYSLEPPQDSRVVRTLLEHFRARRPIAAPPAELSLAQARRVRDAVVKSLQTELGPPVGYKAALTNPEAQKRFGVDKPIYGVLLQRMLLANRAEIPATFAAVPICEGDLIVRVRGESINRATSRKQALAALDAVVPFIELADLAFAPGVPLNESLAVAVNAGARQGVVGDPILIKQNDDWEQRLGRFSLTLTDGQGKRLGEGTGKSLLGHPLDVVLWLKDALLADDRRLAKGDLLSLGSVTLPVAARAGETIIAHYEGLDPKGPVEITVRFR